MLFKFFMLVDAGNVRLLEMGSTLSPRQRPLSCCFDCKGFLAVGLGRGKKRQCMGNAENGKERREGSLFPSFPVRPPNIIQKFPIGSLCGGERVAHTLSNSVTNNESNNHA